MKKIFSLFAAVIMAVGVWGTKYELVTSASQLVAGANYIMANGTSGTVNVMGNASNTNNRPAVTGISVSNGKITATDAMMVLQLGGTTDAWTFTTTNYAGTDGYLYNNNTGANRLFVGNNTETNKFTITFDKNVITAITCNGNTDRGVMCFNSNLVSCYTSKSSSYLVPQLYKEIPAATDPYTVTFNAGKNGTCATTSLTETAANAGVTLPSCNPAENFAFLGWADTEGAVIVNAGEAGDTYYPISNCTLYAVYKSTLVTSFTLVLKEGTGTDGDSGTQYNVSDVTNVFSSGASYVASVTGNTNFYPARIGRGAKLGTSSKTGSFTVNLNEEVTLGKIEVVCAGYGSSEMAGFTINGTNFSSTTYASNGFETLTYAVAGKTSTIAIATQSKRGYVKSITIYPAGTYDEITISEAGYATYYNASKAYVMPDDCEGYVFTAANGLELAYEAEDVVPAGEPLVIHTIEPGKKTLVFTTSNEETYKSGDMNDLQGAATAMTAADMVAANPGMGKFYALSLNADGEASSVGFYWVAANGAAFDITAGKAYLALPSSAAPARFLFNETTALENKAEAVKANKTLVNGQLFILRDGKTFDVMGRIVK